MFLVGLIVAAVLGLIPAAIARDKGRSFGAWWLYGFLIWIVALPHALLMSPLARQASLSPALGGNDFGAADLVGGGTKLCPFCAETIKAQAILCRYCDRDLPIPAPSSVVSQPVALSPPEEPAATVLTSPMMSAMRPKRKASRVNYGLMVGAAFLFIVTIVGVLYVNSINSAAGVSPASNSFTNTEAAVPDQVSVPVHHRHHHHRIR